MAKLTDPPITTAANLRADAHKAWLEAQVAYTQRIAAFLSDFLGWGSNGVLAIGEIGNSALLVSENDTPDMKIKVQPGWAFESDELAHLAAEYVSGNLVIPSSDPRIDIVTINASTDAITITQGAEAGSPSAPATPYGHVLLAEIYHRTTESQIDDADGAGLHGYITRKRFRLNFGGQE